MGTYCNPEQLARFSGWPAKLDSALYWFGQGDSISRAGSDQKPSYYDPSKKTVIYFHGWTGGGTGWTSICKRVTTRCPSGICPEGGGQLLAEKWFADGWNVGFFYWDQFADEDCTRDAEQKIWFDRKGDGFRWKSYDSASGMSTYQVYKEDIVSVTDLCVRAMKSAMGDYAGPHVRFVGHSIGAQLATRCAAALHKEDHPAAPQRLALLEPYFSKHHLYLFRCKELSTDSGIGEFTAAATADYVKSLWNTRGVVTEIYKSSVFTELSEFGVPNEELEGAAVLVQYEPHWCGGLGPLAKADLGHLTCRHCAAFPLYFMSYGHPAPPVLPTLPPNVAQPGSAASTCSTPAASCSDAQIREWLLRQLELGGGQKWVQDLGAKSFTMQDDTFTMTPELSPQLFGNAADKLVETRAVDSERGQGPWWRQLTRRLDVLVAGAAAVLSAVSLVVCCFSSACRGSSDDDDDNSTVRSLVMGSNQASDAEDEEAHVKGQPAAAFHGVQQPPSQQQLLGHQQRLSPPGTGHSVAPFSMQDLPRGTGA